jgi:YHS domain-containing protein
MKKVVTYLFALGIFLAKAQAQKAEIFSPDGKAIKGYDAVAFFKDGKPVKGVDSLSVQWKNATWYFANRSNLNSFQANPQGFAPQYGGYCAYGVSQGHTAPIDPEAWTIIEGKLYLNYSKGVKKTWSDAIPKHIEEANKNWPMIKDKD